ncbi:hypothetical protein ASC66_06415 [Leifsonia sp. Root4]|uniref:hypothetical protein n=1 Tax=Leifsonia sp. Root4 TaxID=1736525 RepID=UPI0006F7EE83|nr:hypothetical protein [Leifsonia sp. Root4]KQW06165.1 hypothetical protein ASC66_06415 [Leifsonia sp. Root4]
MSARRKAIGAGLGLATLLLVSGVIANHTPDESVRDAPFEVRGALGATLTGRNLSATVTGAQFVTQPRGELWGEPWAAESGGVWLVVDAEAACVESLCQLQSAMLDVDGTRWSASERPNSLSLAQTTLAAGIPTAGALLFEVPAALARDAAESAAPRPAELRLGVASDERLDSLLIIELDLSALKQQPSTTITEPGWAE